MKRALLLSLVLLSGCASTAQRTYDSTVSAAQLAWDSCRACAGMAAAGGQVPCDSACQQVADAAPVVASTARVAGEEARKQQKPAAPAPAPASAESAEVAAQ